MNFKRNLLLILAGLATLGMLMIDSQVQAKVSSGSCSDCHTMHRSQDGVLVRDGDADAVGNISPECANCHAELRLGGLLKMDCIGCHAEDPAGAAKISGTTNAPQVAHASATDLAAGNYVHVFGWDGGSKGHNVHGFFPAMDMEQNIIPHDMPPGYDAAQDYGGWAPNGGTLSPLMCGGVNGCHGDRTELSPLGAIKGAHHADDAVLKSAGFNLAGQGATVGTSYRFLLGVKGLEDDDWENTFDAANDHNEYKGSAWGDRGSDPRTTGSISSLCTTCHGIFHAEVGTGSSPWLRHPVDYAMKTDGEFSAYAYTQETPVARVAPPANATDDVGAEENRIVMCLSCHRAHGAPNQDSLRWQYDDTMTSPQGCYNCHRNK